MRRRKVSGKRQTEYRGTGDKLFKKVYLLFDIATRVKNNKTKKRMRVEKKSKMEWLYDKDGKEAMVS